jgi:hypothetical protein
MDAKSTELLKAFDSSTLTGKLVALNVEQASEFVDFIVDESSLLKQVRLVKSEKPNKDFASMFGKGRFLKPGKKGTALTAAEEAQYGSNTFTLSSQLVRGRISFTDEDLQDNIEGKGLSDHFLRVIAKQIANELEEVALYSNLSVAMPESTTLNQFAGWKKTLLASGNVVDGNVGFSDRLVTREKFVKAHKALETKYRRDVKNFLPSDVYIDYTELFTVSPVSNNRSEITTSILGKPIIEVPLMRVDEPLLKSGGISKTVATTAVTKANILAGVNTITVNDSSAGYLVGQDFAINYGTAEEQIVTIKTLGTPGTTQILTLTENLTLPVAIGDTFKQVTRDVADVIITDPKNLLYMVQTTEMEFESFRDPSVGWIYYYKMRIQFGIENPSAAVILTNLKIK